MTWNWDNLSDGWEIDGEYIVDPEGRIAYAYRVQRVKLLTSVLLTDIEPLLKEAQAQVERCKVVEIQAEPEG